MPNNFSLKVQENETYILSKIVLDEMFEHSFVSAFILDDVG